jgi:catechol 2,3-dioxygenase-like lactoylglutathione lyase family enzyme
MLEAIGIVVANPQRSIEFYRLLGVDFVQAGGAAHFEAKTVGGIRLMMDSVELIRSFDPDYVKPTASGVVLCFKQGSPKDVDALYAKLEAAGFTGKKPPWDAFWGMRYACALDPDGYQVDLFAAL